MTRRALITGNAGYLSALPLRSPVADARQLSKSLERLGFKITLCLDFSLRQFAEVVKDFESEITSVDVALFFYSGHGIQVKGRNYIVPIDLKIGMDAVGLIDVNEIIDGMKTAAQRIILLDACRFSEVIDSLVKDGSTIVTPHSKNIYIGDVNLVIRGFAEMRAEAGTFIGFAAAPGEVAYEGVEEISPFTEGLLEHIETIDVPLSNLAGRVRKAVLKRTAGRQHTWDQSSLTAPFYFNPGAYLVFIYNTMAIISLVFSSIPAFLLLRQMDVLETSYYWFVTSLICPLVALMVVSHSAQRTYKRLRDDPDREPEKRTTLKTHFLRCVEAGCLGGFIGSVFGSTIMGVVYYEMAYAKYASSPFAMDRPNAGVIMTRISLAAALFSSLIAVLTLFFSRLKIRKGRLSMLERDDDLITLVGSTNGGVLACILVAPIAMAYFGSIPSLPEVKPELLLPVSIIAAPFGVFCIIAFDLDRLTKRRLRAAAAAAVASVALGAVVTATVFGPLYSAGLVDGVIAWSKTHSSSSVMLAIAGIAYGLPMGIVLGSVIGLATNLTRRWSANA